MNLWRSLRMLKATLPTTHIAILTLVLAATLTLLFFAASLSTRNEFFLAVIPDMEYKGSPQDHPELIAYIRQLHIQPPSKNPYNLKYPHVQDTSQNDQAKIVADLFLNKTKGTFVEAGAYDGEELSNTLYLEKEFGWTGLLVEPDPWNFWSLKKRARKAHSLQGCISPSVFPKEVSFRQSDAVGHIVDAEVTKGKGIFTRVKCFPLYSLLLAMNLTTLDFLSLDVEGKEFEILKTLPWQNVDISVICVEHAHIPEGDTELKNYLQKMNYVLFEETGDDFIFLKSSFISQR